MAEAKIEIKVGAVTFAGEGDSEWLSKQLDKLLTKIPELAKVVPAVTENGEVENGGGTSAATKPGSSKASGTLAAFLKAKGATNNQTRKFLAAAVWVHDSQAKNRLTTTDVTRALRDNNQGKLSNPSQCLIQNVKQGFCEKDGKKQFYVTDEGRGELG